MDFFSDLVFHVDDKKNSHNMYITNKANSKIYAVFYNHMCEKNTYELKQSNWDNICAYKMGLNSKHVCLFNHNDDWYLAYKINIEKVTMNEINEQNLPDSPVMKIFKKCTTKLSYAELDKSCSYHFLLKDNSFRKVGISAEEPSNITFLWAYNDQLITNTNIPLIDNEKEYHFPSFTELISSLKTLEEIDMSNKILSFRGYYIRLSSPDKKTYKYYTMHTNLYKNISSVACKYVNKYIGYVELYQNDILKDVLPYVHKYPANVIKRINASIKVLSKELLNIYHSTRQKQNSSLYEHLPQIYKKILHDLHNIYVTQKIEYYMIPNEILREKKSISMDIVSKYIKKISINDLVLLFKERKKLFGILDDMKIKYDDFLVTDDIDIIIQYELMNLN